MTKHKASTYSKGDFAIYKGEAIIRADTILRTSQPPSVAWNTSKGDTIFIDADSMLEAYTANTAALTDPTAPYTTISAAEFRCEGFPRPLTQADIDALYKRAIDAEDHLRAETTRSQALIARHAEMERAISAQRTAAWEARKEVDAVTERLRMSRRSMSKNLKEQMKSSQADIKERNAALELLGWDGKEDLAAWPTRICGENTSLLCRVLNGEQSIKASDATLAAQREQLQLLADALNEVTEKVKARDQSQADIAKLRDDKASLLRAFEDAVNENADFRAEVEVAGKAIADRDKTIALQKQSLINMRAERDATIKARDQTIADLREQLTNAKRDVLAEWGLD